MTTANVLTSLGAADLDTKQLVTDLVNAVKEPRQKQIDESKKKAEVAVSSIGLLKSALTSLQTAATELGSVGKLNKLSISNSNTGAVVAEAGSTSIAMPGNHSLAVTQLAQAKRMSSVGFASSTSVISPNAFTITLEAGKPITIAAGSTVAAAVSAINSAGGAVSARLINTGAGSTPYQIVLEGASGASNGFSPVDTAVSGTPDSFATGATSLTMSSVAGIQVGSVISGSGIAAGTRVIAIDSVTKRITLSAATTGTSSGDYSFSLFPTVLQNAQDAMFTLNGVAMSRSGNVVTDALEGVTLKLNSTSVTPVNIGVSFDAADIAASAKNFVAAYNVLTEFIDTATGPKIKDNDLSGTLQNDSSVRRLKTSLRSTLTAKSSSFSGNATHWSVLGISLDRNGVLQLDESKFKATFEKNPGDVVKAMSNNASQPYIYSNSPSGLAGDMARAVYGMVRSTGSVSQVESAYEGKLTRLATEQTKLDKQIESVSARYEKQFSALNAVLAEFKATSKRLDSTFNSKNN